MPTTIVSVENCDNSLPSTCLDSGNAKFYRLYAEFDPESCEIGFGEDHPSSDGTPTAVYHGRVIRFYAPPGVDAEQVADVLRSAEVQARLTTLVDGYETQWTGSNHVGRWSVGSNEIIQSINDEIDQLEPVWTVIRFDEYVADSRGEIFDRLQGDADKIQSLVDEIIDDAQIDNHTILVGDAEAVLRGIIED